MPAHERRGIYRARLKPSTVICTQPRLVQGWVGGLTPPDIREYGGRRVNPPKGTDSRAQERLAAATVTIDSITTIQRVLHI